MTDISDNTWKELDADNTSNPPAGLPPGTEAGKLYATIHAMMGANKRNYTQSNPVYTSTGTADLRVYNLNFTGGIQAPAPIGKTIKFNPNFSNVAGIHTLNINGQVYSLKRANGTSDLIAGDIQAGYPAEIVCLAAGVFSHQNSRNIDDNRLPATQAGKSFTSTVRVTASTPLILNDNGTTLSFARNQENSIDIEAFQTSDQSIKNRIDLNRSGGVVTVGGSRVLTLADTGAGKGLDADKLDGQEGSFYLSRANHTGTIDPWMYQPLGVPVAGGNALVEGWTPPQFDKGYQYILLSAGASGYHGNRIINESVTGSWPNISATGTINVPGSPFHGKTVRLINNERRFLRPGTLPGELQQFQNEWHQHTGVTSWSGDHSHELPSNVWSNDPNHATGSNYVQGSPSGYYNNNIGGRFVYGGGNHQHNFTTNGTGGDETRPRNIGVSYYMRVL